MPKKFSIVLRNIRMKFLEYTGYINVFLYLCSPIGVLAQLVERKVRNLEVRSSILLCSTKE